MDAPRWTARRRRFDRILRSLAAAWLLLPAACDSGALPTHPPPEDAEPGRWVILDGANNTRDIGGYATADGRQVRWKQVYRSAALSGLSEQGCEAFDALNIRRLVDFRNRLSTSPLFGGDAACVIRSTPATLLRVTLLDDDPSLASYVEGVADNSASYRAAFALLAEPANLPMLYHCAAGKDRTGIMTALLLTLLGVDRGDVVADYALSNEVDALVDPQSIIDLLDAVDAQGGIEAYLESIGVPAETRSHIRANLLE